MKFRLIDKENQTPEVKSYIFEAETPITWTAGQFMVYRLDHENPDLRGKQRFFTISSAPYTKHLIITAHIENEKSSSFKTALDNLKIGDFIEGKGPDGDFILDDLPAGRQVPDKSYVFIAGGIGITPFRSILKQLDYEGKDFNVQLLYANKTDDFVFKEELEELKTRHPNFRINYVISPQHIDQNYIEENVQNYKNKTFYVSGPEPMIESLFEMLKKMGLKEENIKTDFFPGYTSI